MHYTYTLTGMTCNHCKTTIKAAFETINEIQSIKINLEKEEVILEMMSHMSVNQLQALLPKKYLITNKIVGINTENIRPINASVKSSKLKSLKPLLIIFAYLTIASISMHFKAWDWSGFMLDFMGLFFIVFSFFKLLDLKGFSKSFSRYDPLAKKSSAYAYVYPSLEIGLGLFFLFRIHLQWALILSLLILTTTTIGVIKSIIHNEIITCACLGSVLNLPMTKATLIENIIMISMAILLLI